MPFCGGETDQHRLHRSQAGPVRDDEVLCRAIHDNHLKPKGGVVRRNQVIRKKDLNHGGISLWRQSLIGSDNEVRAHLASLNAKALRLVVRHEAQAFRAIRIQGRNGRPLCLLDDTLTSAPEADVITNHEAHACLKPCGMSAPIDDDACDLLMEILLNMFAPLEVPFDT